MHIDPLGTSAWNTVLVGRKRWVLFPPSTHKRVAKALTHVHKGEDDEATNYFLDLLPRLLSQMRHEEWKWEQHQQGLQGHQVHQNGQQTQGQTQGQAGYQGCQTQQDSSSSVFGGAYGTGYGTTGGSTTSSASTASSVSSSSSGRSSSSGSSSGGMQDPRVKYGCHSSEVIQFTQYVCVYIYIYVCVLLSEALYIYTCLIVRLSYFTIISIMSHPNCLSVCLN